MTTSIRLCQQCKGFGGWRTYECSEHPAHKQKVPTSYTIDHNPHLKTYTVLKDGCEVMQGTSLEAAHAYLRLMGVR